MVPLELSSTAGSARLVMTSASVMFSGYSSETTQILVSPSRSVR